MKIHLIKKQSIEDYTRGNARSRSSFNLWLQALKYADWNNINDITNTFNSADILGSYKGKQIQRVVFNIGGNSYRMICMYHFGNTEVHLYIQWIGTHAEYTKLCDLNKQYSICLY